jgi:type VI secretion system protein ImpB
MAGRESTQHKLDRVRPPRVHIKYQVENKGVPEIRELPFVVGVLADLSGHNTQDLPALRDRSFEEVSRDNLGAVFKKIGPTLDLDVQNRLEGDGADKEDELLKVKLQFESLRDFEPDRLVEKVDPLRTLMEVRRKLKYALNKLDGNDTLKRLLQDVVATTESQRAAGSEESDS